MKVIHLSTSDLNGGAAIAAKRICSAQKQLSEIESKLLVQSKLSKNEYVISAQSSFLDKLSAAYNKFADEILIKLLTVQFHGRFTFPFFGNEISHNDFVRNADIINLHWINGGFLSINSLRKIGELKKPIVWTLHDMWAFTGGCHYSSGCYKFQNQCSNCPSLLFKSDYDFSYKIFNDKKKLYNNLNLTFVTCSKWLAEEAAKSVLLSDKNIVVIPNPLNKDLFKAFNKTESRIRFSLPIDKKLILIGAMNLKDERKGFKYLIEALNLLWESNRKIADQCELTVFGKLDQNVLNKISFKVNQLGKLKSEEEIVLAYNSADVYVAPSLEDNLPNTVMEAMACGVPVVAFNVGGIPDMIDSGRNGILAELKSAKDLAKGIELVLSDKNLHKRFSVSARKKVIENFDQKIVAEKYYDVYKSLL